MKLIVGSRGSKLSLLQTESVIHQLKKAFPALEVEVKIIKTLGDRMTRKPLLQIKEKGIFEKEIDEAVLRGEVDFAVHSMKDIPTTQPPGLVIAAIPKRESPYDVLVSNANVPLKKLPPGSIVGTCSPRREAELYHVRPDLKVKPVRGNVDTRVRKLRKGLYDAIILAEAGLHRLNMEDCITERLSLEDFTPAPGQGALAVVAREDDERTISLLKHVNHQPSMIEITAERALIKEIGGGCKIPLGAIARVHGNKLSLKACILSPDGKIRIRTSQNGSVDSPEEVGVKAAHDLLKRGADDLIRLWRGII